MEQAKMIELITQHAPMALQYVLIGLGSLVTLGVTYVAITPSKDDDAWLLKLQEKPFVGPVLKLIMAFSPVVKKEEGVKLSNQEEKK